MTKTRYDIKPLELPSQVQELKLYLYPFKKHREKWLNDFFGTDDAKVIRAYMRAGSYARCSKQTGGSEVMIFFVIERAIKKLKLYRTFCNKKSGFEDPLS